MTTGCILGVRRRSRKKGHRNSRRCCKKVRLQSSDLRITEDYDDDCLDFWRQKSPWATVWRCLRDSTSSGFDTMPVCDRRSDGRTDGHTVIRRHRIPL